jgi:hypothetical protein
VDKRWKRQRRGDCVGKGGDFPEGDVEKKGRKEAGRGGISTFFSPTIKTTEIKDQFMI